MDFALGAGGVEGAGAGESALLQGRPTATGIGVAPVGDGMAEVAHGTFGAAVGDLLEEGEVVLLGRIDGFAEVQPRGPRQAVGTAEAVSGHAEIVRL